MNHSFVDNFIVAGDYWHGNNCLTTSLLAGKMQQLFLKYNLKLTDRTDSGMGEDEEHISFGIRWQSFEDEITPYINLNVNKSHRGRRMGPGIEDQPVDINFLTRRHVCRVTSQIYDLTGRLLGPLVVTARHYLSKVCKVVPNKDLDKTVISFDENVAKEACSMSL